jgi:hypothetical protein
LNLIVLSEPKDPAPLSGRGYPDLNEPPKKSKSERPIKEPIFSWFDH